MTLYKGNSKIRDRGTYGIYYGSSPIQDIYHGSDLVYRFQPYDTDEVLINSAGEITETITLQKGVYYIEITGGGGRSSLNTPQYPQLWFTCGGGSGASVYGEFYLSETKTLTLYGAPERGISYMEIDNTRIITANNGGSSFGNANGGTGSITENGLITNISITVHNGNAGTTGAAGGGHAGASVSPNGWGKGGEPTNTTVFVNGDAGGIYLQYKRVEI